MVHSFSVTLPYILYGNSASKGNNKNTNPFLTQIKVILGVISTNHIKILFIENMKRVVQIFFQAKSQVFVTFKCAGPCTWLPSNQRTCTELRFAWTGNVMFWPFSILQRNVSDACKDLSSLSNIFSSIFERFAGNLNRATHFYKRKVSAGARTFGMYKISFKRPNENKMADLHSAPGQLPST